MLVSLVRAGRVQERPKASLILVPAGQLFIGEVVTLRCDIQGHTDTEWRYSFYKNEYQPFYSEVREYSFSVVESDSGKYTCRGERRSDSWRSEISDAVTLTVSALPRATLTVEPESSVFTGESVTLKCEIKGYVGWTYQWYKQDPWGGLITVPQSVHHTVNRDTLTIRGDAVIHGDQYWCRGERRYRTTSSQISDPVTLTVNALPRATLTADPKWSPVFSGESVTLKCEIKGYDGWTYQWYKQDPWRRLITVSQSVYHTINRDTLTIRADTVINGDQYWCRGERHDRSISSQISSSVTLTVNALPRATLTADPKWSPVFSGESVTLKCEIYSYDGWTYQWYKQDPWRRWTAVSQSVYHTVNRDTLTIRADTVINGDQYWCRGERRLRPTSSQNSDSVTLTVEETPKPELTSSHKGAALIGNPVVLYCKLDQSAGWRFYWSKHTQSPENETKTETYSYTISSVSVSDGGQYWCRAGRGNPVYYTHYSDALWINTTKSPKAVASIKPDEKVFRGETVTLRCDMQGGGDTEWRYSWNKDDYSHNSFSTRKENTISPVRESDSGKYTCRGQRRSDSQTSEISDAVTLTVSDRAQAVLRSSPQSWLTEGDSVTLSCEVRGSSTGWTFSWYRDKDELLSDSSRGAGGSYTLSPAALNHTGVYACRAMRGETAYHTQYSDTQPLWITGVSPPVSLMVSPSRAEHFITDSLSLSCEGQSDSTGWRVRRYTHSEKVSDCSSGWGSAAGTTCSISSLITSHTGVYWCESESGESSNPVNISVTFGFIILDSPVHPVTEGDPLTLRCLYHHTKPSNLTAEFYKNGSLLQTQTTGEMTIHTVSKSDEGLYHCKHPEKGESPQSWISVRVSTRSAAKSAIGLVGVVVGVSFAVLFIILLILLWCYRTRKDGQSLSHFTGHQQNINQTSVQNHRESGAGDSQSGYMQAEHVYDTVERAGRINKSDAADELSDVTYSQIMRKNRKSKNKGKYIPAKPSQTETIYSEVQPGKTTDADTGSMAVTYAEIELKTQKKPKKKTEQTSIDADTVYSELKQNTDKGDVTGLDDSTSL
ncbi:Fc receptor-like protein 5 isoform X3 [Pygocentrus nattereri]|uniref:Fc receptor-like protein 5 isoform X3 n=1 Tax=Pygocentrus nattereri TaxID=42514 RepID=UPI0018914A13|nr:Fc receptor-like protein 5 isoform X3 [Pygocentrus nattereri]